MKSVIIGLFLGTIDAVDLGMYRQAHERRKKKWVELPNCPNPVDLNTEIVLAADLHNATIATCKINHTVHRSTPITQYVYDPVIRTGERMKIHEHTVTHEKEGGPYGYYGPKMNPVYTWPAFVPPSWMD